MSQMPDYKRGYTDAIRHVVDFIQNDDAPGMCDNGTRSAFLGFANTLGTKGAKIRKQDGFTSLKKSQRNKHIKLKTLV